jgi:hypothetical protein
MKTPGTLITEIIKLFDHFLFSLTAWWQRKTILKKDTFFSGKINKRARNSAFLMVFYLVSCALNHHCMNVHEWMRKLCVTLQQNPCHLKPTWRQYQVEKIGRRCCESARSRCKSRQSATHIYTYVYLSAGNTWVIQPGSCLFRLLSRRLQK